MLQNVLYNNYSNYHRCSAGTGAISEEPLFISHSTGNYRLQPNSPCIDAGDPDPQYNDPDGTRNDIGACRGLDTSPPTISGHSPATDATGVTKDTKIIVLSAYLDDEKFKKMKEYGADLCFSKPLPLPQLKEEVAKVLGLL